MQIPFGASTARDQIRYMIYGLVHSKLSFEITTN